MTEDQTADLDQLLAEHADSLRAHLDQQLARKAELESELLVVDANAKRLEHAIQALLGQPVTARKPRSATRVPGERKTPHSQPRPQNVETVYEALVEHGQDGISITQLAAKAGLANETTRKVLDVLRRQERARSAGVRNASPSSHVKAQIFKPMDPPVAIGLSGGATHE